MTFTEIQYFIDVADSMNFTKAAEKNYIAQQVVSKQIRRLETELGYQLFDRSKRQLELSPAGEVMYLFWKEMLQNQTNKLQEAANLAKGHGEIIRIGCISISPIYDLISRAISDVSSNKWDKQFIVNNDSFKRLCQKLIEGTYDCILSLSDENRDLPDGFYEEKLVGWRPELILSKKHPLYHDGFDFRELDQSLLYVLSTKFSINAEKRILMCCRYYGFEPGSIRYFDDVAGLEMALYAGSGFTVIYPQFFRNPFGELVSFPISEDIADENFLTVSYKLADEERLRPFIDELKKQSIPKGTTPIWV